MPGPDQELLRQQLEEIKKLFQAELPGRLSEIKSLKAQLLERWDDAAGEALSGHLHALAGSSASFGFDELGEMCREAEQMLNMIRREPGEKPEISGALEETLNRVVSSGADSPDSDRVDIRPDEANVDADQKVSGVPDETLVYILDDDRILSKHLAVQLQGYGYVPEIFGEISAFVAAVSQRKPDALIVDIRLSEGDLAGLQVLKRLRLEYKLTMPIIVLTVRMDFAAMLQAERAGASAFLSKPIETDALVYELDRLLFEHAKADQFKILIIDDDEQLARHNALILQSEGMITRYTCDPTGACDIMADFTPDLVIMDIYMPGCNGLELAHILRFHPQYMHIPIVFLSTEVQINSQLEALRKGGDDFLTKPISDKHLYEAISIRAARSKRLNDLIRLDSLTGLLKHGSMKDQLDRELPRSKRTGRNFAFAMLDVDVFKAVNDEHGHVMGDRVIKSMARMLKRRIRGADLAARFGGEEFAVTFFECEAGDAFDIIEQFRHDFSQQIFSGEERTFRVTFSAGIASSEDFDTADELCQAADMALYHAKKGGRNQVCIYDPESTPVSGTRSVDPQVN